MVANGYLPASGLTTVQGSIQLPQRAAQAWFALEAAARSEFGVDLNITSPGGGYRSYAMQQDMYENPTYYGAKPGKVAAPGNSVHGTLPGCVDIYNWAAVGTLRLDILARRFGWRRTITGEPWHYQYDGSTASTAGGGGAGVAVRKGSTMTTLYYKEGSSPTLYALAGDSPGTPANWHETTGVALATSWSEQIGGSAALLSASTWDAWKADYLAPLNVPAVGGGTVTVDVSGSFAEMVAAIQALPAEIDRYADGRKQAS